MLTKIFRKIDLIDKNLIFKSIFEQIITYTIERKVKKNICFQPLIEIFVWLFNSADRMRTKRIGQKGKMLKEELVWLQPVQQKLKIFQTILVQTEIRKNYNKSSRFFKPFLFKLKLEKITTKVQDSSNHSCSN